MRPGTLDGRDTTREQHDGWATAVGGASFTTMAATNPEGQLPPPNPPNVPAPGSLPKLPPVDLLPRDGWGCDVGRRDEAFRDRRVAPKRAPLR
jgi:hypothetical protein